MFIKDLTLFQINPDNIKALWASSYIYSGYLNCGGFEFSIPSVESIQDFIYHTEKL